MDLRVSRVGIYNIYQYGRHASLDLRTGMVSGLYRYMKYWLLEADRRPSEKTEGAGLDTGCFSRLTNKLPLAKRCLVSSCISEVNWLNACNSANWARVSL